MAHLVTYWRPVGTNWMEYPKTRSNSRFEVCGHTWFKIYFSYRCLERAVWSATHLDLSYWSTLSDWLWYKSAHASVMNWIYSIGLSPQQQMPPYWVSTLLWAIWNQERMNQASSPSYSWWSSMIWASVPLFVTGSLTSSSAEFNQCWSITTSPPHWPSTQVYLRAAYLASRIALFRPMTVWLSTAPMPFLNSQHHCGWPNHGWWRISVQDRTFGWMVLQHWIYNRTP